MLERHSPPVQYPLLHSRFLHRLWCCGVLLSAGVLLAWVCMGAGYGQALWIRVGLASILWSLCASSAWYGLQRQPLGSLRWSSQAWTWEESNGLAQTLQGAPVVALDLQWLLVLSWKDGQGRRLRCVLQRDWAPQLWGDVRRAVYSSVHPTQDASHQQDR